MGRIRGESATAAESDARRETLARFAPIEIFADKKLSSGWERSDRKTRQQHSRRGRLARRAGVQEEHKVSQLGQKPQRCGAKRQENAPATLPARPACAPSRVQQAPIDSLQIKTVQRCGAKRQEKKGANPKRPLPPTMKQTATAMAQVRCWAMRVSIGRDRSFPGRSGRD